MTLNSNIFTANSLNMIPFKIHTIHYKEELFGLSEKEILRFKQNVYKLTDVKKYYIIKNIGGGIKNEF